MYAISLCVKPLLTILGLFITFKLMARTGRPPKAKDDRMTAQVKVMMAPRNRKMIDDAVQSLGVELSEWARPILLKEAKTIVGEPHGVKKRRK